MPVELRVLLDAPVHTAAAANGQRRLEVGMWLPQGIREPIPLIVYIHGGGWKMGTKYRPPFQPSLFDDGIGQATIRYRFSSEAPFPACLHDCKLMVRWLHAHAAEYHLDPQRFVGWGIWCIASETWLCRWPTARPFATRCRRRPQPGR